MEVFGWALRGLAGWTAIGGLGTLLAWTTGDRRRAWRSLGWVAGVWALYLAVLLTVSRVQGQKVVPRGQEECFGAMCFAVVGVGSVEEFKGAGGGRLIQVGVQVRNTGADVAGVEGLRAYLVDGDGKVWWQTRGVGGVPLTVRLPGHGETVSQPVFRMEGEPRGLGLVLTREHSGWGWLVIGGTDSLAHKRTVLRLEEQGLE